MNIIKIINKYEDKKISKKNKEFTISSIISISSNDQREKRYALEFLSQLRKQGILNDEIVESVSGSIEANKILDVI